MRVSATAVTVLAAAFANLTVACGPAGSETLTVYSGRSEELIAPLIAQFENATGVDVAVRYGDSAELAATILEEGPNSPADVFLAQDPASIGAVALAGLLSKLDDALVDRVPERFSDSEGRWVGISGRARVLVYDTTRVDPAELPASEDDLTSPTWAGRVAIAPTNGSFLAFVAAKLLHDGEQVTLEWLKAMKSGGAPTYSKNSVIVAAVDDGETDAGLVNHYYLFRRIAEEGDVVVANHFFAADTAASLVMPSGVGLIVHSDATGGGNRLIEFLLSREAQLYFAAKTFEYPLASGVAAHPDLPPLDTISMPDLDLSRLAEVLGRATDLVAEAGLL